METSAAAVGDEILEFLRWMWPKPDDHERALPQYRALAERLRGRKGELMLMIQREAKLSGGCVRDLGPPIKETFSLGVLEDERLRLGREGEGFARGTLSFPTSRHAVSEDGRDAFTRDGALRPLIWDTLFFHAVAKPVEMPVEGGRVGADFCLGAERGTPPSELALVIGSKEIDAWCRGGAMHDRGATPNTRRCALIRMLAHAVGRSGDSVPAVRIDGDSLRNRALARLHEIENRREELFARIEDAGEREAPEALVEAARATRRELRTALTRAEELGIGEEPFVRRLRKRLSDAAK